jgi:hypothetical protein
MRQPWGRFGFAMYKYCAKAEELPDCAKIGGSTILEKNFREQGFVYEAVK